MNRGAWFAAVAVGVIGFSAAGLRSQDPPHVGLDALEAIKANNAALLERQAKALEALEALEKEAQQIKVYAKRT